MLKPTRLQFIILAVLTNGKKYGTEIRNEVGLRIGELMPFGSLYGTLKRMWVKGLLHKHTIPRVSGKKGNRPKYYSLTEAGELAIRGFRNEIK